MTATELRRRLRDEPVPGAEEAEERGWDVVQAAFAERRPAPPQLPRSRLVAALAAAAALAAGVVAITPPGAAVGDWLRKVVDPGARPAPPVLSSLPGSGRLLVVSRDGPWIVRGDGSKRLMGAYDDATWSPRGLYVAAARGRELVALEPGGRVRWSLGSAARVSDPRWSPDGFRIAYRSGGSLLAVAGDGSGGHLLARDAGPAAPAWWPGPRHALALAGSRGRVRVVDADSSAVLARSAPGRAPTELGWSADGRRLLALAPRSVRLLADNGRLLRTIRMPASEHALAAAFAPSGSRFALARSSTSGGAEVGVVDAGGGERRLFATAGRIGDLAWSPDGAWLLVTLPDADQWVLIGTGAGGHPRLRAVSSISRQFDPGNRADAPFPAVRGWCCSQR
jgi:dipeptidyl aminopeptidase/acylaminoacyl peptidase